jgi:hypothetical protein
LELVVRDVSSGLTTYGWTVLPLIAILIMPGLTVFSLHQHRNDFDLAELLAISVGLSIALVGVAFLYANVAGIRIDEMVVRYAASAISLMGLILLTLQILSRKTIKSWPSRDAVTFALCLSLVLTITAVIRFLHIRDVVAPMWVDSVQHAEIVQLIINQGGLPDSYRPFADAEPFSYHFGFHAMVALFHWLSGVDIIKSMLIVGQALNALMALSAYLLAARFFKNRIAGLVSAFVVGLVSVMPAYYLSWGRYTQLTGLVLMPVAIVLSVLWLDTKSRELSWRNLLIVATVVGGLIIAHPRVSVFYLCFVALFLFRHLVLEGRQRQSIPLVVINAIMLIVSVILLAAPWLFSIVGSVVTKVWEGSSSSATDPSFPFGYITSHNDKILLALAGAGLTLGLIKRHREIILLGVWTMSILFLSNVYLVGLPGSGMLSNGAVAITLFLPFSLFIGYLVSSLLSYLGLTRWKLRHQAIVATTMLALGLYTGGGLLTVLNPSTVLFYESDRTAMDWISQNTPPDAKFWINSSPWQLGIIAGTDGGYWIPALTGRKTTLPSPLYALGSVDYFASVNSGAQSIGPLSNSARLDYLRTNRIDYIYVGYRIPSSPWDSVDIDPPFQEVYRHGGVRILKVAEER